MHYTVRKFIYLLVLVCIPWQQAICSEGTWDEVVEGTVHESGFMDVYWKASEGRVYLSVELPSEPFLYVNFLASGVGSNDIGLDRGQLGGTRVVRFRRMGGRILLIQHNLDYRAESDNQDEVHAVVEAFAQSVLWAFDIEAERAGRVLIDITDMILSDVHDVSGTLREKGQGEYNLDRERSAVHEQNLKSFKENTVFEALLTFSGRPEGDEIRAVAPFAQQISVVQRHNFVQLPDNGYTKRPYHVQCGYFNISYLDYATSLDEPMRKHFIARHRLQKKHPERAVSEPVEPIVYYLDRGTPEPVRSALLEGASWWSEAFEAAGFINAFRVEMLPEGADAMDIRYNVIQWVHRSTRGWSYGASVVDPRTGEIIKGHVSLGSLRVRQDYMIAEGLLAPYVDSTGHSDAMQQMALARLRQLSAHEVGHTLGLAHNFAASASPGNSVMDYPHPDIALDAEGNIDLSSAYETGIGAWDKVAIRYGYSQFADEDKEKLMSILRKASVQGYRYISDQDARPRGGAHPLAHLWDNGPDAVAELDRLMRIRAVALERFSERVVPHGRPLARLEEVFVPVYLMHRYQVEAVVKLIGGLDYSYAVRGDGAPGPERVSPEVQRQAIEALLQTLDPETLAVNRRIAELIPPPPPGRTRSREHFEMRTGPVFDPMAAAETAARMVLQLMLHPERCERLLQQHAASREFPGLDGYLNALDGFLLFRDDRDSYAQAVADRVVFVYTEQLAQLLLNPQNSADVRSAALDQLTEIRRALTEDHPQRKVGRKPANASIIVEMIESATARLEHTMEFEPLRIPDGSPIGNASSDTGAIGCAGP